MEKKPGPHAVFSIPRVYDLFSTSGRGRASRRIVAEIMRPRRGQRILDIGCGTGEWLPHLGGVNYHGFDASEAYIQAAKQYHPGGHFHCGLLTPQSLQDIIGFDTVMAMVVLHHLDDAEAQRLFQLAFSALKPGGRVVSHDPCFDPRQSPLARAVIRNDRGKNVRSEVAYRSLAAIAFSKVTSTIWLRPLRIPYTYCLLECEK
jgi:2-polyprenyl-3-methyl-5-hydroxy-6-metoxy-1,4-benzoquinol methylase